MLEMHTHLLRAHVEFSAHLSSVAGINWHRGERVYFFIIIFLLIHSRHQPKVPNFHYIVQREEDIRGLINSESVHETRKEAEKEKITP